MFGVSQIQVESQPGRPGGCCRYPSDCAGQAVRLDDDDLAGLVDSLKQELGRRKRSA